MRPGSSAAHSDAAAEAVPTTPAAPRSPGVDSTNPVLREFLAWVARQPRTEADAMEAWRSSCPRYPIWEDALEARLVTVEREAGMRMGEARVTLTPLGQAVLAGLTG